MPDANDASERNFWIAVTLWGGALVAIFGTGLYALVEHEWLFGSGFTLIGLVGLAYMTAHLQGKRLQASHTMAGALVLLCILLGYAIWDRRLEIPSSNVSINIAIIIAVAALVFAAVVFYGVLATRQQFNSRKSMLLGAAVFLILAAALVGLASYTGNNNSREAETPLPADAAEIAELKSQIATTSKERDAAIQQRDAANQQITALQKPAPEATPAPQEKLSEQEIATKIDIWRSVDSRLNDMARALNEGYGVVDSWGNNIQHNRAEIVRKAIVFEDDYGKVVSSLNNLRNSYQEYDDLRRALDPTVHQKMFRSITGFRQIIESFPTDIPTDFESIIRPYSGALKRDLDAMRDWQTALRQIAVAKGAELSKMGSK